jgi:cytochrome c553
MSIGGALQCARLCAIAGSVAAGGSPFVPKGSVSCESQLCWGFFGGALLLPAQQPAVKINQIPVQATPAESGKAMFDAYCASCHGLDGKGSGPAAVALKIPPTDLTQLTHQNGGKYPSLSVINSIKDGTGKAHGSKEMPVRGPILSSVSPNGNPVVQQRLSNLTSYIESLQAK